MSLFRKKNVFLGIDFGTDAIKAVELTLRDHRPHLTNYAQVSTVGEISVQEALSMMLKKMESHTKNVYVALPGSSGLITLITFPKMTRPELAKAITFEARKHIPLPLEDVNMSWDIVSQSGANELIQEGNHDNGTVQIMLVVAPKKDVKRYEQYIYDTNLTLQALEMETFSLVRTLIGDDEGVFVVVDVGAQATNIIFVKKGVVYVNRNIDTGYDDFMTTIADAMNISKDRAVLHVVDTDVLSGRQSMTFPALNTIVDEVQRVIGANAKSDNITVIVTGRIVDMKGISEYLAGALHATVNIGNTWSRIVCPDNIESQLKKMNGSFAVATGLALRGADEYQRQ